MKRRIRLHSKMVTAAQRCANRLARMFIERTECPACGSRAVSEVYRLAYVGTPIDAMLRPKYERRPRAQPYDVRFAGQEYVVDACWHCTALYQRHAPGDALAAEYYDSWIAHRNKEQAPLGEFTHRIREAMMLTAFLLRRTGKRSPTELSMLDYGGGHGVTALAFRACGVSAALYDISPTRQETARRNGLKVIADADIPGHDFDFINTEQLFEHLPAPRATLAQLKAGLAPRGAVKISVPHCRWLEGARPFRIDWSASKYARWSSMPLQPLEHLTYFRRPSLHRMADEAGLSELRLSPFDEWNYAFDWRGARNIAKNVARPLMRTMVRNYFLFGRTA